MTPALGGERPEIAQHVPPWHQGLKSTTVQCLKKAGITSREALIEAWEAGSIKRAQPPGIGVSRWVELRHWLEDKGTEAPLAPPRAMVIDLTPEAEAALNHLRRASGQSESRLISRLLVEADEPGRNG